MVRNAASQVIVVDADTGLAIGVGVMGYFGPIQSGFGSTIMAGCLYDIARGPRALVFQSHEDEALIPQLKGVKSRPRGDLRWGNVNHHVPSVPTVDWRQGLVPARCLADAATWKPDGGDVRRELRKRFSNLLILFRL